MSFREDILFDLEVDLKKILFLCLEGISYLFKDLYKV